MSGCLGGGKECILIAKRQKRAFNSDRNVLKLDHSKGWKIVNLGKCIELYCLNGWILQYINYKSIKPLLITYAVFSLTSKNILLWSISQQAAY